MFDLISEQRIIQQEHALREIAVNVVALLQIVGEKGIATTEELERAKMMALSALDQAAADAREATLARMTPVQRVVYESTGLDLTVNGDVEGE